MALNRAIDETFGKSVNWTKKEMDLYELLCAKLHKYKPRAMAYKNYSGDCKEILRNIMDRTWWDSCKNKHFVQTLIENMEVLHYECERGQFILNIKFNIRHVCFLKINYNKTEDYTKYYIYLQKEDTQDDDTSSVKGYVAYLNTVTNHARELPEYDIIAGICNIDRYDLIHFVSELLHFYDTRKVTAKAIMGINYPVSIQYLASVTS